MARRWSLLLALVLAGSVSGADKLEVIQGTTGSSSDKLVVHAGGLVLRESEPGVAFGWVKLGKGKRQLSYVVIFKHRLGGAGKNDFSEDVKADEGVGESKQTVIVDGRKLEVVYKVMLDKAGKVTKETLTVNAKSVDVARGRVLLVELTTNQPKWEQKKLKLPDGVEDTTVKKTTEALARSLLTSFAKQDKKTRTFIDEARK